MRMWEGSLVAQDVLVLDMAEEYQEARQESGFALNVFLLSN